MAPQAGFGIEPSDGESAVWIRAENSERSEMFEAVFSGQNVGVTQVSERLWLVTFM